MKSSRKHPAESQAEKFERAAKEHGADEDEQRWVERLKKVAKPKPAATR
jgi:hypothetical protein